MTSTSSDRSRMQTPSSISLPSHPETEDASVPAQSSSVSSLYQDRFYESLEFMSAAAIEAAFSGNDGTLREGPDAYHREADEGFASLRDEVLGATAWPHRGRGAE